VSFSQRSEEQRLYNLVYNLTISNPGYKAVSSNASPGGTVRFLCGDDRGFLKEEVKTNLMAPISPPNNSPTFIIFFFTSIFYELDRGKIWNRKLRKAINLSHVEVSKLSCSNVI
jgi:hypothetical protein